MSSFRMFCRNIKRIFLKSSTFRHVFGGFAGADGLRIHGRQLTSFRLPLSMKKVAIYLVVKHRNSRFRFGLGLHMPVNLIPTWVPLDGRLYDSRSIHWYDSARPPHFGLPAHIGEVVIAKCFNDQFGFFFLKTVPIVRL